MQTVIDRLPLLEASSLHTTGGHMGGMITCSAKAVTPFGALTGRSPLHVEQFGEDSARVSFMCGQTPVSFAVAGDNFTGLIRALIAQAAANNRAQLEAELDAALEEGAA